MGHKNGLTSAYAVEASSKQGKFWEMYDVLFENQKAWAGKESADPAIFENYADQIGLNIEQFKKIVILKKLRIELITIYHLVKKQEFLVLQHFS